MKYVWVYTDPTPSKYALFCLVRPEAATMDMHELVNNASRSADQYVPQYVAVLRGEGTHEYYRAATDHALGYETCTLGAIPEPYRSQLQALLALES